MLTLQSVSSKAKGMNAYLYDREEHRDLANATFMQGDIITMIIKCALGEKFL